MLFVKKRLKPATAADARRFGERLKENGVGFPEGFFMVLSAFLVIVLPCLLLLLGFGGLVLALFGLLY